MTDACTSQPFGIASGATIIGGPDWTADTQTVSSYWDVASQTYIIARNATLVPILVNENIRASGTYISSSQTRLQQAQSGFVQQLQSGTKVQNLGPLQNILSNVTGIVNNNSSSNTIPSASTAVASGTAFASGVSTFYIDFAPFSKLTFFGINGLDSSVKITITGAVDGSFNPEHTLGQSANNPKTMSAGSAASPTQVVMTLTDPWPLIRAQFNVQSIPTQGTLSAYANLRL